MVERVLNHWAQVRARAERRWADFAKAFPRLGLAGHFAWDVAHKYEKDDCFSYAAGLTFWLLISLVPLTTLLFRVLGLVLGSKAFGEPLRASLSELFPFLPQGFVRDVMHDSQRMHGVGVSWIVLVVGSHWGVNQLDRSLAHVFGIRVKKHRQTRRFFWLRRLGLVLGGLLFLVVILALMVGGALGKNLSLPRIASLSYMVPVLGLLVTTMVLQHLPRCHVGFRPALLGAGVSTGLWWLAQWIFGIYLAHTFTWGIMYGSLLKIIAGLIFLYYSCSIFLLGAEITAAFYRQETGAITIPPWLRMQAQEPEG